MNWDELVLGPVMGIFGEGAEGAEDQLPLYMPRGGTPFRLPDAVFDAEYADVTLDGDGSEVTSRRPVLGVRLALFPRDPLQNDRVFIPSNGKRYIVKEPRPDGHGYAKLMLMEAV